MNKQTSFQPLKKWVSALPELWFIILLTGCFAEAIWSSFGSNWKIEAFILPFVALVIIGMLIKQIACRNKWISLFTGLILTFVSSYMYLALLSEYLEFPSISAPDAFPLLTVGSLLCGISILSGILMTKKGIKIG